MSMSTPGPERVPSTVRVGKKSGQGKPPAGPSKSAKVSGGRNWGPIAVAGVVILIAAGIIGYGVFASMKGSQSWQDQAAGIKGIVNYRTQKNPQIDARDHKDG